MSAQFRAGVLGAQGYSGQVLVELLKKQKKFEVSALAGRADNPESLVGKVDVLFSCLPHEASLEWVPRFLEKGSSVIDLSGAFRLKNHDYADWYGFDHTQKKYLSESHYGLQPFAKVSPWKPGQKPVLVANPGCYATAVQLLLIPLLKSGLLNPQSIFLDAKSGTTGAGRKANQELLFSEIYSSFAPYKTGRHQHWPEIIEGCQSFSGPASSGIRPVFVTELLPVDRGISVCAFLDWNPKIAESERKIESLEQAWEQSYRSDPGFVLCREDAEMNIRKVRGTNHFRLRITEAYGRLIAFCAIDNLMRGASSQALMNANQLLGFETHEGLF
jgi:N-acetyl-gamma-glutamyl-phosphate reductase